MRVADAAKAKDLAAALGGGATAGTFGTAPAGEIVILAVPYASGAPVVAQYGEALAGKVIGTRRHPRLATDERTQASCNGSEPAGAKYERLSMSNRKRTRVRAERANAETAAVATPEIPGGYPDLTASQLDLIRERSTETVIDPGAGG